MKSNSKAQNHGVCAYIELSLAASSTVLLNTALDLHRAKSQWDGGRPNQKGCASRDFIVNRHDSMSYRLGTVREAHL